MVRTVFSHMGLTCKDPAEMERFYTTFFGFKRTHVYMPGHDQIVMLKKEDIYIELFKAKENSPLEPPEESGYDFPGWRHICFLVDDLEAKLKEMGDNVKVTSGPLDLSSLIPGMKACWVSDPEGNIIELNEGYRD
jgi:glyoxylase I family protein